MKIFVPVCIEEEAKWIIDHIFSGCFEASYSISPWSEKFYKFEYEAHELFFPEFMISRYVNENQKRMPDVKEFRYLDQSLVTIGCLSQEEKFAVPFDIIGSIFFVLSGLHEKLINDFDSLGRPITTHSFYKQTRLFYEPFVDKHVEFLRQLLELELGASFRWKSLDAVHLSSDLDLPFREPRSLWRWSRKIASDLIKRKSPIEALQTLGRFPGSRRSLESDSYFAGVNTLSGLAQKYSVPLEFFIIADTTDKDYEDSWICDPDFKLKMAEMTKEGHRIGVHPGIKCSSDIRYLRTAVEKFMIFLDEINYNQDFSSRFHFLKFDPEVTPEFLVKCGVTDDKTIGFNDNIGFRRGTSRAFKSYDLASRKTLTLKEHPLHVMDITLTAERYLNLKLNDKTLQRCREIKGECSKYGGTFSILWHNSNLETFKEIEFLDRVLS